MADFEDVRTFVQELQLSIVGEDPPEGILVVEDEDRGIKNLVIDCDDPVLIFEQLIMEVPGRPGDMFKRLLQMNRTVVHGALRPGRRWRKSVVSRHVAACQSRPE